MKAEYRNPSECGKWISLCTSRLLPFPIAADVVAHSPTPSMVSTTASSNGDGKNALAAWLRWCSLKSNFSFQPSRPSSFPSSSFSRPFRKSFSLNHRGIAMRNDLNPRGANVRYVSTSRSNFRNGLS